MKTWIAQKGQSIYDLSLQLYGSLDFILKLMQDNNIDAIHPSDLSGRRIIFDETLVTDNAVINNNGEKQIIYVTDVGGHYGSFDDSFDISFD